MLGFTAVAVPTRGDGGSVSSVPRIFCGRARAATKLRWRCTATHGWDKFRVLEFALTKTSFAARWLRYFSAAGERCRA